MSWVRVDDSFPLHPKIARLWDRPQLYAEAVSLWLSANCWSNKHSTDGLIPLVALSALVPFDPAPAAAALAGECKLWKLTKRGYVFHDFASYNPTRAQKDERRRDVAERVKRHRNSVTGAFQSAMGTASVTPAPAPPHPSPEVQKSKSTSAEPTPAPADVASGPEIPVPEPPGTSPAGLLALWNEIVKTPRCRFLTPGRKRHALARLREHPNDDWWRDYFGRFPRTPFLRGENDRGWRADFDFALQSEDVVAKVLEGGFDKAPAQTGVGVPRSKSQVAKLYPDFRNERPQRDRDKRERGPSPIGAVLAKLEGGG